MPPVFTTADWHYRNDDPYATTDAKGVSDFLRIRAYLFERVVKLVAARAGHLLIAGDFLESTLNDSNTMYFASQSVARLAQLEFALLLEGNHGYDSKNSDVGAVSHWKHLVPSNVAVVTYPKVVQTSEIDYHCIPPIPNITDVFPKVAADLLRRLDSSKINILVLHGPIVGALYDSGTPAGTGIKKEQLEYVARHYDRVVCGDFHRYQQVLPNTWYCGSPLQTSLRDKGQQKGIQVFEGRGSDHRFLPLAGPRFFELSWDVGQPPPKSIANPDAYAKVLRQAVVLLKLSGDTAARASFDLDDAIVRLKRAGALRVVHSWIGNQGPIERAHIKSNMGTDEMVAHYVDANPPDDLPKGEVIQVGLSYLG